MKTLQLYYWEDEHGDHVWSTEEKPSGTSHDFHYLNYLYTKEEAYWKTVEEYAKVQQEEINNNNK